MSLFRQPYNKIHIVCLFYFQLLNRFILNLDSNNLMNPSIPNLTPAERQSEELNNHMMSCLR
jgi:hypothetical protein